MNSTDRHNLEDVVYAIEGLLQESSAKESVADNLMRVMEVGDAVEGLEDNLVTPDRKFVFEAPLKIYDPQLVRDENCNRESE